MIKSLSVKNFTVFFDEELVFGRNLNIFVGENGTGKSHALKLAYSLMAVLGNGRRESKEETPGKAYLKGAVARKLLGVFRPDNLGRLAQRRPGVQRTDIMLRCEDKNLDLSFGFNTKHKAEVDLKRAPKSWAEKAPVFLPTHELLSIYPGFVQAYESSELPFEETWRDACMLLGAPLARGPRAKTTKPLLEPLEKSLGGEITLDSSGRFYLHRNNANIEMHLVAEGLRKLAMVARLVATGSLVGKGCLFWDEPEANLNPRLIKEIARAIIHVGKSGIQVFVATHSLFLLRELYLLQPIDDFDTRCFGLSLDPSDPVNLVNLEQGATMDDIGALSLLDEEILQSDRYLEHEEKAEAKR